MAKLTTDDLTKITVDMLIGRTPRIKGPEADAERKKHAAEIAAIKKKGFMVHIPGEWEVTD